MLQLAQYFDSRNPSGLIASEKFDGIRALWTGTHFLTRTGNVIDAPEWFTAGLPDHEIDGELWCGRGTFGIAQGMTKRGRDHKGWESARFMAFDLPNHPGTFTERAYALAQVRETETMKIVNHFELIDMDNLRAAYRRIRDNGGEGVMLRDPDANYSRERTTDLLKLKPSNHWSIEQAAA